MDVNHTLTSARGSVREVQRWEGGKDCSPLEYIRATDTLKCIGKHVFAGPDIGKHRTDRVPGLEEQDGVSALQGV